MMTKIEAVAKLFNEYTDSYGRVTLNPARLSDPENGKYDSENQGLWTGEAGILLHLTGDKKVHHWQQYEVNFHKAMDSVQVHARDFGMNTTGLFSRHPRPYYLNEHHNVSKDEYRGFSYGYAVLGGIHLMNEIIEYGESNDWFYVDDDPHGGFNKDHLGAFRLPTDRCLYKIVAGKKPSVIELLSLGISAWLNSRKPERDTSSKIMSWFNFKAARIVGFESKILDFFEKRFDKNMKMCYNDSYYMEKVFKIYFPADHPFQTLIKGL